MKHGAGGAIRPGSWSRGKIDKTKKLLPLLVDIYKDCKDDETKKSSNSFTTRKPAEGMDRSKKP